jgi:hypothetical protein
MAATQSSIFFSFETDSLRRVTLAWSNRGGASVAPLHSSLFRCDKNRTVARLWTFARGRLGEQLG